MNFRLFYKALILMLIIAVVSIISFNMSLSMQGGEDSLFSFVMSFIGLIFLAPFIWWTSEMRELSSLSEGHYYAAMFFDIVVYAYIIERLSTLFRNWKTRRRE